MISISRKRTQLSLWCLLTVLYAVQSQLCPKDCLKCSVASSCQVCQEGFYISGYLCAKCQETGCAQCPGNKCTECMTGFNLVADEGSCVDMRSGKKYLIWGLIILFVIIIIGAFLLMWKWKTISKFFSSFFNELNRVKQLNKSLEDSQSEVSKKWKESVRKRFLQPTCVDESGLELNTSKKTDEESRSGLERTNIKAPQNLDAERKSLKESAKDIEKELNGISISEREAHLDSELGKNNLEVTQNLEVKTPEQPQPIIPQKSVTLDAKKDSSKKIIVEKEIVEPVAPQPTILVPIPQTLPQPTPVVVIPQAPAQLTPAVLIPQAPPQPVPQPKAPEPKEQLKAPEPKEEPKPLPKAPQTQPARPRSPQLSEHCQDLDMEVDLNQTDPDLEDAQEFVNDLLAHALQQDESVENAAK